MVDLVRELLAAQNECTLIWRTTDGSATGAIVSYFAHEGRVYMTARAKSNRVRAIARDSRTTVVVSGKGTELGHARSVSLRGVCSIHQDAQKRDWFFPRFSRAVLPDSPRGAEQMTVMMNEKANVVLEFDPERIIPYDAHEQIVAANRG